MHPTPVVDPSREARPSTASGRSNAAELSHIQPSKSPQRLDPTNLLAPPAHVRSPSLDSSAGSQHTFTSGPVGTGRAPLLMRRPRAEKNPVLVYDQAPPARKGDMSFFRCTADLSALPAHVNKEGLDTLRLAGCERISSVEQVQRVMDAFGGVPIDVIDLREELHAVADDYPVSLRGPRDWVNVRRPLEDVERLQAGWPDELRAMGDLHLLDAAYLKGKRDEPREVHLAQPHIRTVRELVEAAGSRYHWAPSPDHMRPGRDRVDRFIRIVRNAKGPVLVVCNGGRGRTTTYMIKYDMLRNAERVSADDIIERQSALGYQYNMTDPEPVSEHKRLLHIDRLAFLREYHSYAEANPGGRPLLYSEWRLSDSDPAIGSIGSIGSWLQEHPEQPHGVAAEEGLSWSDVDEESPA